MKSFVTSVAVAASFHLPLSIVHRVSSSHTSSEKNPTTESREATEPSTRQAGSSDGVQLNGAGRRTIAVVERAIA
jgi:hypothetical protein